MKTHPAHEISPDHQITPPAAAQGNTPVPPEIFQANQEAAHKINTHKDDFIKLCLESIISDEEIGEIMLKHLNKPAEYIPALIARLDPAKLKLTLRDDFSPTLIIPSENHPEAKRQKGYTRHTGHTLQMFYDDRWLGTMTIEYNEGRINIVVTTKSDEEEG